jgi:hypothetical protein
MSEQHRISPERLRAAGEKAMREVREAHALERRQVEQLAYIMQFLYELGFDVATVKRAADAWWEIKSQSASGA